jgi:hypothetical protein
VLTSGLKSQLTARVGISGFDRFAGVEGIRGCCNLRAVTSDKVTGVRTDIPPPLQYVALCCWFARLSASCCHLLFAQFFLRHFGIRYPISKSGFAFVSALITMFYGDGVLPRIAAVGKLIAAAAQGKPKRS